LILVSLAGFLYMVGLSVIFPVMPRFTRSLGLSELQAGLLFSSYALASFVVGPLWGRYSQRSGRRPAILIGLVGLSGSFLWLGLAESFTTLLAARTVGGLVAAAAMPAIFAYAADASTAEGRGQAMALVGASIGVGVLVGVLLGGLLGEVTPRLPFFATAAIGGVSFLVVQLRLPESLTDSVRSEQAAHRARLHASGLTSVRLMLGLAPFLLFSFLFQIGRSALEVTLGFLLIDRFGRGTGATGLLLGIGTIIAVLVQGGAARSLRGRGAERACLLIGTALVSLSLATVGGIEAWGGMFAAAAVFGLGGGMVEPAFRAELSRVGELIQGEAQGLHTSAQSLARVVAFAFFPWCYARLGAEWVYSLAAFLCAGAFFTARLGLRAARPRLLETGELAPDSA
jgi:predicted MFS family arabinose efflux permease